MVVMPAANQPAPKKATGAPRKRYPMMVAPDPTARRKGPGFREIAAMAPAAKVAAAQRIRLESFTKTTVTGEIHPD